MRCLTSPLLLLLPEMTHSPLVNSLQTHLSLSLPQKLCTCCSLGLACPSSLFPAFSWTFPVAFDGKLTIRSSACHSALPARPPQGTGAALWAATRPSAPPPWPLPARYSSDSRRPSAGRCNLATSSHVHCLCCHRSLLFFQCLHQHPLPQHSFHRDMFPGHRW